MPVGQILAETAQTLVLVIAALFPIVNPLGGASIFLSTTEGYGSGARSALARKVGMYGLFLLLASLFAGTHVLAFFGVSLAAVQVGGGLVVASSGWSLLNRSDAPREPAAHAKASEEDLLQHAFYPLTLPLTVGPGSISVAITLGANLNNGGLEWNEVVAAVVGVAVIAVTVWLCYASAERVARIIGPTGTSVVVRLSSFILLCIGVQILGNGIRSLMRLGR